MTKTNECVKALMRANISEDDALALRRIAMTLRRWHERECGDSDNYKSFCLVRGRKTKDGFEYDDNGKPYVETHVHTSNKPSYHGVPDLETAAKKRLAAIMSRYADMSAYIQTDPRGAALYILRAGDVPAGEDVSAYYSRGIAVY